MRLKISVVTQQMNELQELQAIFGSDQNFDFEFQDRLSKNMGAIVFLDGRNKSSIDFEKIDRRGRAIFLIVTENRTIPSALMDEKVDDVLVFPFRVLEVMSKVRHYHRILMWEEVSRLNSSFSGLLDRLHDDLKLAERIQKAKQPLRFPAVKGFQIKSRYLIGEKAGGDFFDMAESPNQDQISLVLTDSSNYGLSSSVLSVLMKVMMNLSREASSSSYETVRKISDQLLLTLGKQDRLSLFYGVISRKDLQLSFVNLGGAMVFHSPLGKPFAPLPTQGGALSLKVPFQAQSDGVVALHPDDRLVVVSDGFTEALGGSDSLCEFLNQQLNSDAEDLLTELVYRLKGGFQEEDFLPQQDCTAIVLDVDSKVVRMIPRKS